MNLWKLLTQCMALMLLSSTLCAQIKPTAMVLPINFVNLDKKGLQGSMNNHVKTELSTYYDLKTEKEIEQARDAAVDRLSSENCTEEACVKIMGELLDVEYTFSLEIIDTEEGWDLTVVRQDIDGVSSRRNELCIDCSLSKARKSLSGILVALRPGGIIKRGKARLLLESTPRSQVFLNGRDQGKTPLDLSVDARVPLEVLMIAEGYNDFAEEFILKPGENRKKHSRLTRKRGIIRISSNPSGAKIYINGKPEMDSDNKPLLTPADLRLVYGQHDLKLQLEKYEVTTDILIINKRNAGTKNITLKPKPGRLIVRVPSDHKQARIMLDDDYFGSMNGSIVKNFEVPANVRHSLHAEDGNFKSETKSVLIEPDGSEKVEFENFTETKKTPIKLPDWFSNLPSIFFFNTNPSATIQGSSENKVELSYSLMGIGLQWGRLRLETTNHGNGSIKNENNSSSSTAQNDYFYFSDGTNIHRVDSTSASIWRMMFASELPEGNNPENSWIWGIGYESVTLILLTQDDGERIIKMNSPFVDAGYQINWNHVYLNFKFGYALTEDVTNFSYSDGFSFGIGFVL